jgi:PAS domain S-box-containing protein
MTKVSPAAPDERSAARIAALEHELSCYKAMVDHLPIFTWLKDARGRFLMVNQPLATMLGIPSPNYALGKTDLDLVAHELAVRYREADREVMRSGQPATFEEPYRDGWLATSKVPVFDEDGGIVGTAGFARDNTEEVRQRFDLELITFAIDQAQEAVYVIDSAGNIIRVNETACRVLGYSRDELQRMKVPDIDPDMDSDAIKKIWRDTEAGHGLTFETRHKAKDGRIFPVEIGASTFIYGGRRLNICLARDITERKRLQAELARREREFRSLVENSPDAIVRYDLDGRRIYVNPACVKALGLPAAALIGQPAATPIIPNRDGGKAAARQIGEAVGKVLRTRQPDEAEVVWDFPEATVRHWQMRFQPEYDGEGRLTGVLAVGRDVSALKGAEVRLRKSHDLLRALARHREDEREKERQTIAHQMHEDLAQNLSAIRMSISLLEMIGKAAPPSSLLKSMRDMADRSIASIREMVSVLRPTILDAGIAPALRWLAEDFGKGLGLVFDLALQEEMRLDDETTTLLFRAAKEAIINSVLHGAASHVRLSLEKHGTHCRLRVEDNGRGFDTDAPFPEGAFGLLGIDEQTQHLCGKLTVISTPDRGTTVTVWVPRRRPA